MAGSSHVVFMNLPATGHMNPTLPLVAELHARGCKVTYFVKESMRQVVEAAGASWRDLGDVADASEVDTTKWLPKGSEPATFPLNTIAWAVQELPAVLEELRALRPPPTAIVYDHFISFGPLLSHVLGLPGVSLVTVPGPGVLEKPAAVTEDWESNPLVQGPRDALRAAYGYDVLAQGMLTEHFSPRLNLTTTVEELFAPPRSEHQRNRFGDFPFDCIGVLADAKVPRVAHAKAGVHTMAAALPTERIEAARRAGSRVLYVSLGTVANSHFWNEKFGPFAQSNGIADLTGKQFLQHVFRMCFEAFGGDEGFFVVASIGPQPDALDGLPPVPANFEIRETVPQLQVLPLSDAFVTHGGANSMHEALGYGVPLAVVPMFGDQPINAETIARCGAGISFRNPMTTLTVQALRDGVRSLADPCDSNPYRAAAIAVKEKFAAAGGVQKAADSILEVAAGAHVARGGA